jgi:hypothetical protein
MIEVVNMLGNSETRRLPLSLPADESDHFAADAPHGDAEPLEQPQASGGVSLPPDEYVHVVQSAARATGPSRPILNRGACHARVIVANLFEIAERHVDIVSGSLFQGVYAADDVSRAALAFLRRPESRLRIAIEKPAAIIGHPLLEEIKSAGLSARVEIRVVPEDVRELYDYHFMVVDGASYRVEGDKGQYYAVAKFRDPENATIILERFQEIWDGSVLPDVAASF